MLLCTALLFPSRVLCLAAPDEILSLPEEAAYAHSLPYSGTLTFTHGEPAGGEVVTDIRCQRLGIVTVSASGNPDDMLELRAYTDSGELISLSSGAAGERCILQFLPAYTGCYRITTACRNTSDEVSEVSLHASEFTKYKSNEAKELPLSAEHSKKTHRYTHATAIYSAHTDNAEGWEVSAFSLSHEAGDVISYTLNTTGDSLIRAILYTYDGGKYSAHPSHQAQGFKAGDAQTADYAQDSYLIVYSSGEFTLEASLLKCKKSTPAVLSLPYEGTLDMTGGEMCYHEEEYSALISKFPFCGVKNKYAKYFEINADKASVIALICERREHSYFSLSSDEAGLSAGSVFPLRSYSTYCSETEPKEMCLDSVISDSGKAYAVYTGNALDAYVEIKAEPLYSDETHYENEYHKNTPLPSVKLRSLYSDTELYSRLGLPAHDSESAETVGYVIECEDTTKFYYGAEDTLIPPEKKGECRLYAAVRRICVREGYGKGEVHLVPLCSFKTTGVIFIPTLEEIIEDIENKEPISVLYFLIALIPIGALGTVVFFVLRRKKRKKAKPSRIRAASVPAEENEDNDEEEETDD